MLLLLLFIVATKEGDTFKTPSVYKQIFVKWESFKMSISLW